MARTNIDIDEEACALVMKQRGFTTKRDAVNYALRRAVIVPMTLDEILTMPPIDIYDIELDEIQPSDRLHYLVHERYYTPEEARAYLARHGVEYLEVEVA